ncbi:MAG: PEP-CTERM sorting domain-containing protein [Phycisphaerae bacterium]
MLKLHSILLAACGGSALLALGCGSFANASVVYNDSLTEYTNGTNLNTQIPGPAGNSNAWTAPATGTEWLSVGTSGVNANGNNANAFLPFSPSTGYVYTLQATIANASGNTNWAALGFLDGVNTGGDPWTTSLAEGWTLIRGANGGADQAFIGPGTAGGTNAGTVGTTDPITVTMTLTTNNASPWTIGFQYVDALTPSNSSSIAAQSYTTNPTITDVGFGESAVNATVKNFSLTATPIPEPAPLGLVVVGALGLLLLKRRRA